MPPLTFRDNDPASKDLCDLKTWFINIMKRILFPATLVLGILSIFAISIYFQLESPQGMPSEGKAEFLEIGSLLDANEILSIDDIVNMKFTPRGQYHSYGYRSATLWYRLRIKSEGISTLDTVVLHIGLPNIDEITLYYRDGDEGWATQITGDTIPRSKRPMQSALLKFALPPSAIKDQFIYFKIKNSGSFAISLHVRTLNDTAAHIASHYVLLLSFFALNVVAIVLSVFLYYTYQDKVFLLFILNQTMYVLAAFSYSGMLSLFLYDTATDTITTIWLPLAIISSMLFITCFFQSINVDKWVLRLQANILLGSLILLSLQFFIDSRFILEFTWYLAIFFVLITMLGAWLGASSTYISKYTVIVIFTVYAFASLAWKLPLIGVLPPVSITFYGAAIQGLINITLILSIVSRFVGQRYREIESTKKEVPILKAELDSQEQISKFFKDLLWMMSHEVGTGLAIFRISLSKPFISTKNHERMKRALSNLEGLINKLRLSESIAAGALTINPSHVSLIDVIKSEFKVVAGEKSPVRLKISNEFDDAFYIVTDENILRIILGNVFSNATRYSEPETEVEVCLGRRDGKTVIMVENACSSDSLPDQDRVFDLFYRGEKVLDRPGSGLGLYIVRTLLQILGGECAFEVMGEGAVRFTICLAEQS